MTVTVPRVRHDEFLVVILHPESVVVDVDVFLVHQDVAIVVLHFKVLRRQLAH